MVVLSTLARIHKIVLIKKNISGKNSVNGRLSSRQSQRTLKEYLLTAIATHDLTKYYGNLIAVDHLTHSVDTEIFALLRTNG
ncbi:MAG: hypothetical protein WCF90_03835 [Methanomicrobiales archaeon]